MEPNAPLVSIHLCIMTLKIIWPFIFNLICIDRQLELGGYERSAISCKSLDYVLVWPESEQLLALAFQ